MALIRVDFAAETLELDTAMTVVLPQEGYAPPPVVYAPPPRVVYAPPPVVYAPPPVAYGPSVAAAGCGPVGHSRVCGALAF